MERLVAVRPFQRPTSNFRKLFSISLGKSTTIQLLLRYYDATDGFVSIDEKDVTSITLKNLRAQMGMVSQEPSLFDRTIAENIAYGDNSRDVSIEEIIEAAKQANIHNFVVSLPLVSHWWVREF